MNKKLIPYYIIISLIIFQDVVYSQQLDILKLNSQPAPVGYSRTELKTATAGWKEVALPCYLWSYGCATTAASMLAGYYDRHGFYCVYNGNVNGGAAPLWWDSWTQNNQRIWDPSTSSYSCCALNYDNSIAASKNGSDGRTTDGHVDDFWVAVNRSGDDPDPWNAGTPPHNFFSNGEPCVADYIGANQDEFGNMDGVTSVSYLPSGGRFSHRDCGIIVNCPASGWRDITKGLELFFEDGTMNRYTVNDVYNQYVNTHIGGGNGFTFDNFKTEIDAGRPVIVHFRGAGAIGHTCAAYGYNDATNKIVLYDTWVAARTEINWGGSITDPSGNVLDMEGVTVLVLDGTILKNATNEICKVGIITGIYDDVNIMNPPSNTPMPPWSSDIMQPNTYNFAIGSNIRFYAQFNSRYCDTYAWKFNWKIELYHKSGKYEYMTATTQGYDGWPTYCKSSSQWKTTASSNIPNLDWERNEDGSINGKIIVQTIDNNGYVNTSDEVFITVNYKPNKPVLTLLDSDERTMTFNFSSDGATSYKVYYGLSAFPPFSNASGIEALEGRSPICIGNKNTFSLTDINKHTTISVTGVNQFGESDYSNTVSFARYANLPYSTGFENCLDVYWTSEPSNSNGCRYTVYGSYSPHTGNYCLAMGACNNNVSYASNYADMHLNLQNEKDVVLEFWWKDYSDEYDADVDGIWFSNDGGSNFIKVYDLNGEYYSNDIWRKQTINISSIAKQKGVELTKNFIVRFAQKDNYSIPTDGFAFDDIAVYSNYTPPSPVKVTTHTATKDAMLVMNLKPGYEYIANTNYGSYPMIKADEWTHSGKRTNSKSIFEFDLLMYPMSTLVKSAHLSLYANDPQPNDDYKQMSNISTNNTGYKSNACWLKRIIQEWDENTVTYSTEPQTTTLHAEYLPISETYTQNYLNFDVTRLVQDMIKYPNASHGFMLELADEIKFTRMAFASSDHSNSSLHPKLSVEYYFEEPVYNVPFTVSGNISSESNNWNVQGSDGKDKAFLVYIPSTITIDATTCSGSTNYDTKLEIFRANKATTGYYNDDYSCSYSGLTSSLIGKTLTHGYYYFVVDGYNGAVGNFQLTVSVNSTLKSTTLNEDNRSGKIEDNPESMEVLVYPNPVCDVLQVVLPEENTLINIVDLNGKVLKTIKSTNTNISINCSDLIPGLYVIQVKTSKSVEVRLFEKQ